MCPYIPSPVPHNYPHLPLITVYIILTYPHFVPDHHPHHQLPHRRPRHRHFRFQTCYQEYRTHESYPAGENAGTFHFKKRCAWLTV